MRALDAPPGAPAPGRRRLRAPKGYVRSGATPWVLIGAPALFLIVFFYVPIFTVLSRGFRSADGSISLGGWVPSHDGRYVAYKLSQNNTDSATMYVRDVEAGADLIYYFEILTGENHRWFHPDPLAGSPYLYLPVRPRIQPDSDGPDA